MNHDDVTANPNIVENLQLFFHKKSENPKNPADPEQYKYKYNNPEKYIEDTIWTESITPPTNYEYTGEKVTTTTTKYEDLGRWVTTPGALGEYTYNVTTKNELKD